MAGNTRSSTPREPQPEDFIDPHTGVFDGQAYCLAEVAYRGPHAYPAALKRAWEFHTARHEQLSMHPPLHTRRQRQ